MARYIANEDVPCRVPITKGTVIEAGQMPRGFNSYFSLVTDAQSGAAVNDGEQEVIEPSAKVMVANPKGGGAGGPKKKGEPETPPAKPWQE